VIYSRSLVGATLAAALSFPAWVDFTGMVVAVADGDTLTVLVDRRQVKVRLVALDSPCLERDGKQFRVSAGMLVSAEVNLGSRTVMEYLFSPVQKITHEAGREM
jgi:multidrug efflux pump subunit AcrA (membrane-fusion protein)